LQIKDEFLANMSHELRTPLNAIMGLSESLIEQTAGPLNDKQEKYLQTVNESGHHLLELINDILDLAKIESGEETLNIEKVDIHHICEASMRMLKQQAKKKNQNITCEIDESIKQIWADERRLKQMIVNLLSNAVKFTPEGGKLGIEIEAEQQKNIILINIWDEGIGISKENRKFLFTPFVQLDSGLAREGVGTGLGLALVKELTHMHHGNLTLKSEPDQGSTFTISLPWNPAKVTGPLPPLPKKKPKKETLLRVKGKNILLVEDTEAARMMLKDYLELRNYQVSLAENGLKGIAKAREVQPDLILMDVMMPIMDGLEATKKIKSDPLLAKIPIVGMTALAMPKDREDCLAAGMSDYMSKPFEFDELLDVIEKHLSSDKKK
jgi:CheY-like chemotaxis protein/two-component sensor histidine kinase